MRMAIMLRYYRVTYLYDKFDRRLWSLWRDMGFRLVYVFQKSFVDTDVNQNIQNSCLRNRRKRLHVRATYAEGLVFSFFKIKSYVYVT